MDFIPGSIPAIVQGGAFAVLIVAAVVALFRGDIVPRKVLEGRLEDRDKIIEKLEERIADYQEITARLLGTTDATEKLLTTINQQAGGEPHA